MIKIEKNIKTSFFKTTIFMLILSSFTLLFQNKAMSENFDQEITKLKDRVQQDQAPLNDVYVRTLGYLAVRVGKTTLCDYRGQSRQGLCRSTAKNLWYLKLFAESNCSNEENIIKEYDQLFLPEGLTLADMPDYKTLKNMPGYTERKFLCRNMDNCNIQIGKGFNDICKGFNSGDASLIEKGQNEFNSSINRTEDIFTKEEAIEHLAIYTGYKQGRNQDACEQIAEGLQGYQAYLCEVFFSEATLDTILDGITEDLANFLLADMYQSKDFCENIKNTNVKEGCLSETNPGRYFNIENYYTPKQEELQ